MNEATTTLEILDGGTSIEVRLRIQPGSNEADHENVKVLKVSMRDLPKLAAAWGKEPREIAVYTGRPDAWIDRLTEESWEQILQEGRRLNFLTFKRFFARNQEALDAISGLSNERIRTAVETALNDGTTSRKPSSS